MTERLWAPWRMAYIEQADDAPGCLFCRKRGESDEEALIVHRGRDCFIVLNLYPYNNGHLMVAPYEHRGEFSEMTPQEVSEVHELLDASTAVLRELMMPHGFNVGLNMGRVAGAGVEGHLHWHVVPRWNGDTNFMPVLADVKVMPEHLQETRRKLAEAFACRK